MLSTERLAHLSYGRRLPHCGISTGLMSALGHKQTSPGRDGECELAGNHISNSGPNVVMDSDVAVWGKREFSGT